MQQAYANVHVTVSPIVSYMKDTKFLFATCKIDLLLVANSRKSAKINRVLLRQTNSFLRLAKGSPNEL
jgi:hypothetical protein